MQDDHPAQPTPLSPEQWQAFRKKQRDDGYARQQAAKAARERAAKNGGAQPPPTDPWDRGVRASDVPLQPEHPEEQIAPNLAAALALAAAGILVFPALISEVWNEAKQEYDLKKKPAINGWQENASSDPHVIRGWWRIFLDAVPGIELGRSGMLVLDLDRHPGAPDGVEAFKKIPSAKLITPKPPMTKTGGNGFHVFFMQPEGKPFGNGEGNLPDGINVRGSGGWAVAPGAVFGEKVWRGVEVNPPLADAFKAKTIPVLPAWLASIIQPPKAETDSGPSSTGETSDKRGKAWAEGALRNIADRLASLSHTGRNNACFSAACKLGQMIARGWIGYETVRGRLTDAMHKNGYIKTDGAAKIADTIKRGIERGMETPHPNPRDNEKSRRYNFNEAGDIFEENAAESEGDKSTGHSWDDPDWTLIDDRRGDLPDLPLDVFTAPWQDLLLRASHGAGVRPEGVAVPLIGVASSLIGTARRVRPSLAWSEPITCWTCVVANSGDRKTPGLKVTTRALDHIEKENSSDVSKKRLTHETRVQKAKEVMKKWKEDRETALNSVPPKEPPIMPVDAIDPGNFIEPRLYATDPTIERLAALLLARPRGMMLIRDELAGLFANMGRYSGGSDRPFWLEAWNGGRHIVERVSGSTAVPHLLIGVVGAFQPDKLSRAFAGDEDGMYGRFLYAWPSTPDYRPLSRDADEFEPPLINALTALIRLPAEDACEDTFTPTTIWLSDDAIVLFEEFRRWSDVTKRGLGGHELHWFVKGETSVLRLAATLSYMAWAISKSDPNTNGYSSITGALEPKTIGREFMEAAIRLWKVFFWPHARAVLRQIGLSDRHKNARLVLRWIKVHGLREVSTKDIRRDALGGKMDAEDTQRLLDGLEKSGWLRKVTTKTDGRPRHRWEVNPKLVLGGTAETADTAEREE